MKKIFFSFFTLFFSYTFAQNNNQLVLKKDQVITGTFNTDSDADFEMGSMKTNSNSTIKMRVIGETDKTYIICNEITHMKTTAEGMGQSSSFDSDNADDKKSELGKQISEKINHPDTISIDKKTGKIIPSKKKDSKEKEEGDSNIMESFSGSGGGNQTASEAFLIIPDDKKTGDFWIDSTSAEGISTKKVYTIISIENQIATIQVNGIISGSSTQEIQGNDADVTINATISGQITSNIISGLVMSNNIDINMNNTISIMGKEMQVSTQSKSSSSYSY